MIWITPIAVWVSVIVAVLLLGLLVWTLIAMCGSDDTPAIVPFILAVLIALIWITGYCFAYGVHVLE